MLVEHAGERPAKRAKPGGPEAEAAEAEAAEAHAGERPGKRETYYVDGRLLEDDERRVGDDGVRAMCRLLTHIRLTVCVYSVPVCVTEDGGGAG